MTGFMNQFMRICNNETHEIITNVERAFREGRVTREERNEVIMSAIAHETEIFVLGTSQEKEVQA